MNPQVFRHLWFIGVLMQFYVIVPFIVWLMWKLRQTKLSSLIHWDSRRSAVSPCG